ncbi:hypothetical protein EON80_14400 [bacterium]|nr:MAG: hypothetical protein EON80_14400 [bacterium]
MKFFSPLLLAALAVSPLLSGCASGPSGGTSTTPTNRLAVTLTIDKTLDPNFYYAVAFDDVLDDGAGPIALEGGSITQNKVIDGNWRVLVLFHQNFSNPTIYYRSDPANRDTERVVLGTNLLFQAPRVTTNSLNFILNLDAKLNTGDYFFSHTAGATPTIGVDRLSINYAATNTIYSVADPRFKPVDAYESQTVSVPVEFIISSTRSVSLNDPQGDRRPGVDPSFASVNFGQMDVRKLDLSVTRID